MSQLKQVQQILLAGLLNNHEIEAKKLLKRSADVDTLAIYRNSILGNHLGAFSEIYPVIKRLIGETCFEYAFIEYCKKFPNHHYDISVYGEHFSEFLLAYEPCKSLKYLPDTASLEWMCHRACLGAPIGQPDFSGLEDLEEAAFNLVCFELPFSSSLLLSEYPVLKIFEVNQDGYEGGAEVSLKEGGCKLFIWRKGLDLRIEKLTELEFLCLGFFKRRRPLKEMLYDLKRDHNLTEQTCQSILSKMIQKGWLVGFTVLEYSL